MLCFARQGEAEVKASLDGGGSWGEQRKFWRLMVCKLWKGCYESESSSLISLAEESGVKVYTIVYERKRDGGS